MNGSSVSQKLQKLKDAILGAPFFAAEEYRRQTLSSLVEDCAWEKIFGTPFGVLPEVPKACKVTRLYLAKPFPPACVYCL